jgi:plastocyanin
MDKTIKARDFEGNTITLKPGDRVTWDCPFDLELNNGMHKLVFALTLENKDGVLCAEGPMEVVSDNFKAKKES